MNRRWRAHLISLCFLLGALLIAWLSVALGSQQGHITFSPHWLYDFRQGTDSLAREIIVTLRAPRAAAALLIGICLAVSGQVLQGTTRNPLADPYLLGISGGAGLLVVIVHALPFLSGNLFSWLLPVAGFTGAVSASFLVLRLARGASGRLTILSLVLSGVVVNAFCAALITFLLSRFEPLRLRITTLWLAGSVSTISWPVLLIVASAVLCSWLFLRLQAHRLNALALGEEGAAAVGVSTSKLLRAVTILCSLLTGLAVALGGMLGYVGLLVPHLVRLIAGQDFRATLPLSAAAGALLVGAADIVARLAFAPEELPLGVLTALLGCPLLLWLLRKQMRGEQ